MFMKSFAIVAHRGVPTDAPENTIASFQRAVELGADAIELDVRLTADHIPVVYHYYYLDVTTTASGPLFDFTLAQLRQVEVCSHALPALARGRISTLHDVLEQFGGRIGLEIEIKGPEPESVGNVSEVLRRFQPLWDSIEVTSYEPAILLGVQECCPGIMTDWLAPRTESWMRPDAVAYRALHGARLARARAAHLHITDLSAEIVAAIRRQGIEVHAWGVNDGLTLERSAAWGIPRICTDDLRQALAFRAGQM